MTNPLLARFIPEARDLLQSSASGLLKLEKDPRDVAAVNEVFRAVHTLKGSSGLFDAAALTRLVHVAEDLLGEVRALQRELDSDLVDLLLEGLDQVSHWVDHLERHECLPSDADQVCKAAVARLRALCASESVESAEPDPGAAPTADVDWIADIAEADRLGVFRQACCGHPVLAVHYAPAESCFYNGEDPFNLVLKVPGLGGLRAVARKSWPALADLDPYQCNLEFFLLSSSARTDVEHLFRYVADQVRVDQVQTEALISLTGDHLDGPVYDDFTVLARPLASAQDWTALREATAALLALTADGLHNASALRWLAAALDAPFPNPGWVIALIEAVGHGGQPAFSPTDARRPVLAAVNATPALSETEALLRGRLLAAQRQILTAAADAEHVRLNAPAVTRVLANLAASEGDDVRVQRITEAGLAVERDGDPAPLLAVLDSWTSAVAEMATSPAIKPSEIVSGPSANAPAAGTSEPGRDERGGPSRMLRVEQGKVDLLMNLIGEMVVSKNSLPFLARRAEQTYGSREMAREIKDQYTVIDRLVQEMQGAIMQVRMLPVSEVFDRFPRLVRDLARKLDKKIDLVIEGEETAADKAVIEALGDPLLHIVRNASDHGIELPAERRAAGKPEQATIRLSATQQGDHVVIAVTDDGRGIDAAKVRAAAIAKGVIDEAKAALLSEQEAIQLIFRPGFSTAAQISDLSGRGVGLDVVLTTIEKLGGSVDLTSRPGEGSTFSISLPLSMAVTRVMVVDVAGELYGIPMDMIVETVRVRNRQVRMIKQSPTFVLRDSVVPLVRLAGKLSCTERMLDIDHEEAVLVCRVGGAPVGLVVDNFRESMDVILKPFDGVLAGMRGFSGTALLGDGHVLLVLDLREIL